MFTENHEIYSQGTQFLNNLITKYKIKFTFINTVLNLTTLPRTLIIYRGEVKFAKCQFQYRNLHLLLYLHSTFVQLLQSPRIQKLNRRSPLRKFELDELVLYASCNFLIILLVICDRLPRMPGRFLFFLGPPR